MKRILASVALTISFSSVNAALIDRGSGLIYDSDLNITWLKDANHAMTSGYDADGRMTWQEAIDWASQLNYAGFTEWRLPTALNPDGVTVCSAGECDQSEMGHLHYIELNGLRGLHAWPSYDSDFALFSNSIQEGRYWSGTVYDNPSYPNYAWYFQFDRGGQGGYHMNDVQYAWAVHDGDIGASVVPVPAAIWLFGTGLFGFMGMARYKKSTQKR